jgi:hypothetical protein
MLFGTALVGLGSLGRRRRKDGKDGLAQALSAQGASSLEIGGCPGQSGQVMPISRNRWL